MNKWHVINEIDQEHIIDKILNFFKTSYAHDIVQWDNGYLRVDYLTTFNIATGLCVIGIIMILGIMVFIRIKFAERKFEDKDNKNV